VALQICLLRIRLILASTRYLLLYFSGIPSYEYCGLSNSKKYTHNTPASEGVIFEYLYIFYCLSGILKHMTQLNMIYWYSFFGYIVYIYHRYTTATIVCTGIFGSMIQRCFVVWHELQRPTGSHLSDTLSDIYGWEGYRAQRYTLSISL